MHPGLRSGACGPSGARVARQGIMFWRWDAVNTVNLGEGDSALTIGINSNTFQARLFRTLPVPCHPCQPGALPLPLCEPALIVAASRRAGAAQAQRRAARGVARAGPRLHCPAALCGCPCRPCSA